MLGTGVWGVLVLGAGLVAVSRTMDYRHDVWDVCAGSVVGMGCAWGVYREFFGGEGGVGEGGRFGDGGEVVGCLTWNSEHSDRLFFE